MPLLLWFDSLMEAGWGGLGLNVFRRSRREGGEERGADFGVLSFTL